MTQRKQVSRWLAAATVLIGIAAATAATGSAQPGDDNNDYSDVASGDALPPPAGDLTGKRPSADTLAPRKANPYPDLAVIAGSYDRRQPAEYFSASNEGVWFSTPLGLNCGIWDRGSFGCTGDIRGAPPGTTNIGWINSNNVTRFNAFDPLLPLQFPPGRAEQVLPPRTYLEYNGTRCATMADGSTYCGRGPFQFLVTPTKTILSPP